MLWNIQGLLSPNLEYKRQYLYNILLTQQIDIAILPEWTLKRENTHN